MLLWTGSAVRLKEKFSDEMEQEGSDDALQTNMEGFQKHISATTRLQLYWHDSDGFARHVCPRAIEVGEFEMIVDAEKPVRVGTVVVVNTPKSGFVGRACIRLCEPQGLHYKIDLCILASHAREL